MKTTLSSRERVNRMFARADHDRVPRYESFWPETLEGWLGQGVPGTDRFDAADYVRNEVLKADLHSCGALYWPHAFPERYEVVEEDEETVTRIGPSGTIERHWKNKSGTPEHIGWECTSGETWEQKYKPAYAQQDISIDIAAIREGHAAGRSRDQWVFMPGVEPFEAIRAILGDESFMITTIEDPEWIIEMADVTTENSLKNFQALLDAGLEFDGLFIYGDMAFKNMMFCSPESYRELIWPQHKRLVDFAHANGMKFIYHTDGDVRKALDLYIEAGFDCLQPLEAKASMDLRELTPAYGERLAFFGNVNAMELIDNDLDRVEAEVKAKVEAGKGSKGYIYHSDHSIPPQVTWATYQHLVSTVDRHGRYD